MDKEEHFSLSLSLFCLLRQLVPHSHCGEGTDLALKKKQPQESGLLLASSFSPLPLHKAAMILPDHLVDLPQ